MLAEQESPEVQIEATRAGENKEPRSNSVTKQTEQQKEPSSNNYQQEEFPPLMEEKFFIEHPENFENKFYNRGQKFDRSKSREIFDVMSKKNRHAKKGRRAKPNNKPFRK